MLDDTPKRDEEPGKDALRKAVIDHIETNLLGRPMDVLELAKFEAAFAQVDMDKVMKRGKI